MPLTNPTCILTTTIAIEGKPMEGEEKGPREHAADRPRPVIGEGHPPKRRKSFDPRFQPLEESDVKYFRKNYAFIGELRRQELQKHMAQLKEMEADQEKKNSDECRKLKAQVLKEKQRVGEMDRKRLEVDLRDRLARAELDAVAHGKKPYYVRDDDIRRLTTAIRYTRLAGTKKGDRLLNKVNERRSKPP
ncbi:hypothetical protein GMRT_12503 [Giardia muris]|uniref:rRNA biogenesis protein RRP36 n=1 Tax=Giardia muris TaxID=5742 RepID=A0A4Z1T656_GIAMU|nr:hypothetical protein GMRT_12503 [Giardia muris]|eukprot:TNJ27941.1 hypothetical protein GMRT_12503 [Giardia muris]